MCEKKIETLKPIINACGEKAQMLQSIEELSELSKALCKYIKTSGEGQLYDALQNVTEEMADVLIMIDQLMIIFDNEKEVQQVVSQKIERTYKRLGINE